MIKRKREKGRGEIKRTRSRDKQTKLVTEGDREREGV